jgi:hypothetical protein
MQNRVALSERRICIPVFISVVTRSLPTEREQTLSRPYPSDRNRLVLVVGEDLKKQVVRRAHENYCSTAEWTRRILTEAVKEKPPVEHRAA